MAALGTDLVTSGVTGKAVTGGNWVELDFLPELQVWLLV
jgi:hypothetical protein